jgi:uncharacterized protein (TIGR04255 family)
MSNNASLFHFPSEIKLRKHPLIEAWLELRWKLEPIDPPHIMRDPGFALALGIFFEGIKEDFPFREDLPTSQVPDQLFPYQVRHRFRPAEERWPVIQIGPGVATINYVDNYNWKDFYQSTIFLRNRLHESYEKVGFTIQSDAIILRYRNAEKFNYGQQNILDFLKEKLNIEVRLPQYIPSSVSTKEHPNALVLDFGFDLERPKGNGTIKIGTGQTSDQEAVVWEISIASVAENVPEIFSDQQFSNWMNEAHDVVHEWFFSLVEGTLFEKYSEE